METYFITGGAGFIGANFIHYMFRKYGSNIRIINIDKLTYAGDLCNLEEIKNRYSESNHYIFEKVDICDVNEIGRLFKKYHPDYIINFAAESHVDRSIQDAQKFIETNVLGTQILLDTSNRYGVKRFHQISTDEVYGTLGANGLFTENTPLSPRSPYSASKASADLICQAYFETHNLPLTISRCSNNYGQYQFPEKLIPLTISRLLEKKPIPIYGNGINVRDWLHVDDHCSAVDIIVHNSNTGEIYNIGGNNEWRNIDLVELLIAKVRKMMGHNDINILDSIVYVDDRKGHDFRYAIDSSKIKKNLNWVPAVPFHQGIETTTAWYLNKLQEPATNKEES